jgi:hypothetical protein
MDYNDSKIVAWVSKCNPKIDLQKMAVAMVSHAWERKYRTLIL